MKTEIMAFLGIICIASIMEEVGSHREKPVKSYIEVLKSLNETRVYYLKPKPNTELNSSYCNVLKNRRLASLGIKRGYNVNTAIENRDDYYKISDGGNDLELILCAGEIVRVYLKQDVIVNENDRSTCRLSQLFCFVGNTTNTTMFWDISPPEVLATGEANIWNVTQKPLLQLISFNDTKGTYILQLFKKIKLRENLDIWVTNTDELIAREVRSTSDMKNFSQLKSYLKYSRLFSSMEKDMNQPVAPFLETDEMIFLIFILIVPLVACYFFERVFGLIINCIIISRARRRGRRAMWCNVFSQNMINYHLHRCQFDNNKLPVENFRHSNLNGQRAPYNLYDEVFVNK